jgi:autotransporter-associated beta strand protein
LYFVAGPGASSGNAAYTVTVSGSQNAYGLWFQSSGAPTLSGTGTINLYGGGVTVPQNGYDSIAQGAVTISAALALQGSQTWTNNSTSNPLTVAGNVANDSNTLTVGGPGNTIISGFLGSGSGGLVKTGTGTLMLQEANGFSGGTSISGGTLNLANGGALQASTLTAPTAGSVAFDQSVTSGSFNLGGLTGSGNITLQNNAATPAAIALSVGGNNSTTTYSGALSGSGSFIKAGTGTLTFNGTNSYSGGTTVNAGTLAVATTAALPYYGTTGNVGVGNGGTLALSVSASGPGWTANSINSLVNANSGSFVAGSMLGFDTTSGNFTYGNSIPGSVGLTKIGSNMLTLSAANTYTGLTTITGGTLSLAHSGALSGSTLVAPTAGSLAFASSVHAFTFGGLSGSGSLSLQNTAAVALTVGGNNASTVYSGILSGSGSLAKVGTGSILTLTGSNTYSGGTTISAGVLQLGDGTNGHDGSLSATGGINTSAYLVYDLYGQQTYSGVISGTGSLTTAGPGTLILAGSNTFTGGTAIVSGTLQLGDGTNNHDGSLVTTGGISNSAALVYNLYGPLTYPGSISGTGSLTKAGTGSMLTLSGSNTFSGTTTITGGTLNLANSIALEGSTVLAPTGSSYLTFDPSVHAFTFGGLSGSGNLSLQNTAAVALTVGGNNASTAYSGALSGSGSLTKLGAGTLTLTGPNTFSGGTTINGGALTVASSGVLTSASGKNLYVGNTGPASMTIQQSASVSVGGELDVNFNSTGPWGPSMLTLTGGSLGVTGPTVIGRAQMNLDPSNTSAAFYQSGGTATLGGLVTVGYAGTATSLLDISGGAASAAAGLVVGNQGNGTVNIHGSGSLSVAGTQGLVIGQDSSQATCGTLTLSNGTLSVANRITLGSGGNGTLVRSGGTLVAGDGLAIAGNAMLVVDNTTGALASATSFAGTLTRTAPGTLTVVPYTGNLSTTEAISFGQAPSLANGILGPWAVRQSSGTVTSADYLTTTGSGPYSLATASYTNGFSSSGGTLVLSVSSSSTLTGDKLAYAVKFGPSTTTTVTGHTLQIASGGLILNGSSTIYGGTLSLADTSGSAVTGLIFAGSQGTISSTIQTSQGLVKFGPGTLVLSGNNGTTLGGPVTVDAGTLYAQSGGALGSGSVTVAEGASLALQSAGGFTLGNTGAITLNGTGVGGSGALANSGGNNSLGNVTLASNSQINVASGSLTLGPVQGSSYSLTKAGTGTLVLASSSDGSFPSLVALTAGALNLQNNNALGTNAISVTVANGATVQLQGCGAISNTASSLSLSGAGSGNGAIENVQGSNSFAGPITLTADSTVGIDSAPDTLTLSGNIVGGYTLSKTGSGTLVLSGTGNSFTGAVNVLQGSLSLSSTNINAGSNGPLGAGIMPVGLGSSGQTGTLVYAGTNATSSRNFVLAGSGTGNFQVSGVGVNLTLSGAISGNGGLTASGPGMLTLNGPNVYTGTTSVSGGTLAIGASGSISNTSAILVGAGDTLQVTAGSGNQLPPSGNITLAGGNFSFAGNGAVSGGQQAGTLVINSGDSTVTTTRQGGTSYTPYISFAGISRVAGGNVSFSSTNCQIQVQSPPALVGGIMPLYATFNNADFATCSATAPYTISALALYSTGNLATMSTGSSVNAKPTGSQTAFSSHKEFNSLNLTGGLAIAMTGSGSLALDSGELLANDATNGTISGGTLMGAAGGELDIDTFHGLTISSSIVDHGTATALVKLGADTLVLSGSNTYTGGTYAMDGLLVISNSAALPTGSALCIGPGGSVCLGDPVLGGDAMFGGLSIESPAPFQPGSSAANVQPLGSPVVTATPEPGTLALLLAGLVGLGVTALRRRTKG